MLGAVIVWLVGTFIFFFLLYNVIQHALNTSNVAQQLKEIKELLARDAKTSGSLPVGPASIENVDPLGATCPACGGKVKEDARECPHCGLSLAGEQE